jgi:hypothetical protein
MIFIFAAAYTGVADTLLRLATSLRASPPRHADVSADAAEDIFGDIAAQRCCRHAALRFFAYARDAEPVCVYER